MTTNTELLSKYFIKPYLGIIKIYTTQEIDLPPMYGLYLINNHFSEDITFYRITYKVVATSINNQLVFDSFIEQSPSIPSSPLVFLDVEFVHDINQASQFDKIQESISSSSLTQLTNKKSSQLIASYKKALAFSIRKLLHSQPLNFGYSKINPNTIHINGLAEFTFKQLAIRLDGEINKNKLILIKQEDFNFEIKNQNINIPNSGTISLKIVTQNERQFIRKYSAAYRVSTFFHDNSSKFNKFLTALSNSTINSSTLSINPDLKDIKLNSEQIKLYNNLISGQLTVAEGFAGTGKTTTIVHALKYLLDKNFRILIVSHPHRVIDNILDRLVITYPDLKSKILRLASPFTTGKIDSDNLQYYKENRIPTIVNTIRENLEKAIKIESNPAIKELQQELHNSYSDYSIIIDDELSNLIYSSFNIAFTTIDNFLNEIDRLSPNKVNIEGMKYYLDEFDLILFEDSSDVTFIDFLNNIRISNRWAIIGDRYQINPIVSRISNLPNYNTITLAETQEPIEKIENMDQLKSEEFLEGSVLFKLKKTDELLMRQVNDIIPDFIVTEDQKLALKKNYRINRLLGNWLEATFDNFMYESGGFRERSFNFLTEFKSPISIIDGSPRGQGSLEEEYDKEDGTKSYHNAYERQIVIETLVKILVLRSSNKLSIGIISPYLGQSELMIKDLRDTKDKTGLMYNGNKFYTSDREVMVDVGTIHKMKSREFDLSIITFSRSEIIGNVGRADHLLTAMTRARFMNILVFNITNFRRSNKRVMSSIWHKILREINQYLITI